MAELITAAQAAQRLGVAPSRVRALIAHGTLTATMAGSQWLIDADSLDRHHDLMSAGATGRSFSPRIAWGAAALCDGRHEGLTPTERTRLRHRLANVGEGGTDVCAQVQRWLSRRAQSVHRYRVGERDLAELLSSSGVMATGISAIDAYSLGLATGGAADAYVSDRTRQKLVDDFVLIDSARGNLTLRVTDADVFDAAVAPRLIAGVDLTEDTDTRTRTAGCNLIGDALRAARRP
ncbi:MAG: helix-turn-helix domain-containing protein [Mycobacterium sp.]